ncbi:DUF2267 domain-containing protein [Nonomuraea angiospora]|uniref:Uncharacterized protein (DUF2267 family) n=2 Tax=Nonomuraea angiospora TaxID=46172 RepID=A0ABR9MLD7_9ACTN|nr:DUF2267 domain-containing protein [Nonomuraea angiospora]MBE1593534.1 uncharacterized protein (DUF2267 family) [Nonomuraea angiospora]
MYYDQLLKIVEQQTGAGPQAAERAVQATLRTLSERLPKDESRDLLRELPPEAMPWLYTERDPETFGVEEFLRRVAERAGVDVETAGRHTRAVFWAMGQAVSPEEFADMAADLPDDFETLVAEAERRYVEIMPAREFLAGVAERAGLDYAGARRATEAALETLAERIAPGKVEDLVGQLPVQLHAPLKRGVGAGPGGQVPLEEFVRRIATREGVSPERAREHARAVFAMLRESIAGEEYADVAGRLPGEYRTLLPLP